MAKYIIKRILSMIPAVLIIVFVVFFIALLLLVYAEVL